MLGKKILKLRKLAGMTQDMLAKKVKVSRSAVTKWETGKANPKLKTLKHLAKALNCNTQDLI